MSGVAVLWCIGAGGVPRVGVVWCIIMVTMTSGLLWSFWALLGIFVSWLGMGF